MEAIGKLEKLVGGVWYGVSLLDTLPEGKGMGMDKSKYLDKARFCEIIIKARNHQVLTDPRKFKCLGARYAFGCGPGTRDTMIRKFVEKKEYPSECVEQMINETPCLQEPPAVIALNVKERPDVFLAKLQPEQAMGLIKLYHKKMKRPFQQEISGLFSLCANIVVKALVTQDMTISFGCEDARTFGGITRDRLYVGMPYSLTEKFSQ